MSCFSPEQIVEFANGSQTTPDDEAHMLHCDICIEAWLSNSKGNEIPALVWEDHKGWVENAATN